MQSITTRQSKSWENELGSFKYHSVKQERFFGYQDTSLGNDESFLCAAPGKALIDVFYFHKGGWNESRLYEMRFQNLDMINMKSLLKMGKKMNSKKVSAAIHAFSKIRKEL